MRVLTFGWEFPPHISGGLGTACFGLTSGLLEQDVEVLFVVPHLFGDEDKSKFCLLSASEIEVDIKSRIFLEQMENLKYMQVGSSLVPYISPEIFSSEREVADRKFDSGEYTGTTHFEFSGHYGKDLMKEVAQYAIVAADIAKEHAFDIIHAHDWLSYPAGIVAKEVSGKPLVAHIHATEFDRSGEHINQDVYTIEKRGLQFADAIIAVSERTKQTLIERYGVSADKIKVVHNGLLTQKPEPPFQDYREGIDKIVSFMGRVTFQKGPEYFIKAAQKVLRKFPDVHFVMAGSGDMLPAMIKMVGKLRLGSRFHFAGFLKGEETGHMYAISDVFVMPSVSEPFGITPLEAIQAGVPVIISKQSGVAEVLNHVLKVDFWDVDALADAICALIQYKALSKTFVRDGRKEVDNLQWKDAALKVKKIYQSLVKNSEL